jgi:hypothetical protein
MEFIASNPNPPRDEIKLPEVVPPSCATRWIVPKDGCL